MPFATIHMMSGRDWVLTYEDLLIAFAILLLAVEIMKATRMGMRTIVDHILAMALFIVMLIEFLLVRQAGTSTFFLLTMIALVDVLAGFIVSIRSSQRQVEIDAERAL
jgi:O-antigen ligase